MSYNVVLPPKSGTGDVENFETKNNLVLIGANGSGKTRLAVWIEEKLDEKVTVHRISAQKALNIPNHAILKNLQQAQDELQYGENYRPGQGISRSKKNGRWGGNPNNFLQNDYSKLLSLLFAKSAERDRIHTSATRIQQKFIPVPDAPIDIVEKIWSELMPHRSISFDDGKITATSSERSCHGKDMSDGERVIIYLLGQCLCIPDNSIIIIDEPEIHIHKSIISKLWDKIEEVCPNKLFIYITHDLEFAASRIDAIKLWIKAYNGANSWVWDIIPQDQSLPENLMLEILGNRKKIIFCEGETGSFDSTIYQLVYPQFHIIPRGGGDKVIESTKALKNNPSLHHLEAFGIIDSDYKEDEEKDALLKHGIFTLPVAEIESLFCIPTILKIVSEQQGFDFEEKIPEVINFLVEALKKEFDAQVSSKAEKIIEYKLGAFSKKGNNQKGLEDGLEETLGRIDIPKIYKECNDLFQEAIDTKDLDKILLIYNRKSLPDRISSIFKLATGEYVKLLIRLMKGTKQAEIIEAFKEFLPEIK